MRQDPVTTGQRADLLRRKDEPRLPGNVAEGDDASPLRQRVLEELHDFIGRGGWLGELDEIQLDSEARRLLLPRTAAARVLLVRQEHLVARRHVEAVADDIVALGGVPRQRQLIDLAVEERGQRLAGAAD